MRWVIATLLGLLLAPLASAQTSSSFKLEEHVFSAGGHPSAASVPSSPNFRITMGTIGESAAGRESTSPSYSLAGGFAAGYPPPREVLHLLFLDDTTLTWDSERSVGVYNLYRDALSALSGGEYGSCEQPALPAETASDAEVPDPPGDGFFYLVTAENRLHEEGTKGSDSTGETRPNPSPCP